MACTVCNHPQRQAIDLALLDRTATLAQLSEQHQLSKSALQRHKQHLLKKMAVTQNRFHDLLKESYLFILNKFLTMVWRLAQESQAEGNSRQLLQAVRQGTAIMKFMAKLDGSLTGDTVHRLLASPQWAEADSLLPTDPRFVADCRQALAHSLSLPCPEEPPSVTPEDLALMQHYLQSLNPEAPPPPSTPTCHVKRQKGGKKAGNPPCPAKNITEYQAHRKFNQIPAKSPDPFLKTRNSKLETQIESPAWLQALDQGRLDINTLHAIGAGRPLDLDLDLSRFSLPA